ncbi:unnamed protein product [Ranitomeya imitator]|uniref:Ceramide-1-phosphate transfer protein n=1 Tax=Ranitomeya imitator TaxID=111125 RepID=A0ABN9LZG6_9NEOB|nr:unnamed protein product [Ranitomeya imitator]
MRGRNSAPSSPGHRLGSGCVEKLQLLPTLCTIFTTCVGMSGRRIATAPYRTPAVSLPCTDCQRGGGRKAEHSGDITAVLCFTAGADTVSAGKLTAGDVTDTGIAALRLVTRYLPWLPGDFGIVEDSFNDAEVVPLIVGRWRELCVTAAPATTQRLTNEVVSLVVIVEEKFTLREVLVSFKSCLVDNDEDVIVEHYLNGWKGLVRFMNSLGTIFSFVSKDAVNKIQIMENYLKGENGERYRTLQSMVEYELSSDLVDVTKRGSHPESGCRTVLRLHRALRWLQLFLEKLRTSSEDSKTSTLCSEAYNDSLANYHPWIIRKTATVAFLALPARNMFFEVMNVGTAEDVVDMLGEAMPYVSKVYDFTQELYSQHNLLDLP